MSVPAADDVAELLLELSHSQWPTDDVERVTWCRRFDLPDTGDPEARSTASTQAFSARAVSTWPGRQFGWHTYQGEFVGVRWFLWDDLPKKEALERAVELKALIDHDFGAPVEAFPGDPVTHLGFTSLWQRFGRTVDLYFHTGFQMLPTGPREVGPAVVQLHLDDTERADAQEAHARLNPPSRPTPPE